VLEFLLHEVSSQTFYVFVVGICTPRLQRASHRLCTWYRRCHRPYDFFETRYQQWDSLFPSQTFPPRTLIVLVLFPRGPPERYWIFPAYYFLQLIVEFRWLLLEECIHITKEINLCFLSMVIEFEEGAAYRWLQQNAARYCLSWLPSSFVSYTWIHCLWWHELTRMFQNLQLLMLGFLRVLIVQWLGNICHMRV